MPKETIHRRERHHESVPRAHERDGEHDDSHADGAPDESQEEGRAENLVPLTRLAHDLLDDDSLEAEPRDRPEKEDDGDGVVEDAVLRRSEVSREPRRDEEREDNAENLRDKEPSRVDGDGPERRADSEFSIH